MKILFNYASRSRPELFKRGIESIVNNCESSEYDILAIVDKDDEKLKEYDFSKVSFMVNGLSENKVNAINRCDKILKEYDIIVNFSDDMIFNVKGFDNIIRENFIEKTEELDYTGSYVEKINLDQCLHFPDGNRTDLITMSIMGRDYYNRFGYIYNPEYKSLYCDNEQTEVAKMLGCYKYVDKQIFEHLHPAYGKAIFDAQYQHTESFNEEDRQTYLRRKGINFGL